MYNGYARGPSEDKLEIVAQIQQLLCEQVGTINRKLELPEMLEYMERNAQISMLFRYLGCDWATPAQIRFRKDVVIELPIE